MNVSIYLSIYLSVSLSASISALNMEHARPCPALAMIKHFSLTQRDTALQTWVARTRGSRQKESGLTADALSFFIGQLLKHQLMMMMVCLSLYMSSPQNTIQNLLPPDKYHSSDVVYRRRGTWDTAKCDGRCRQWTLLNRRRWQKFSVLTLSVGVGHRSVRRILSRTRSWTTAARTKCTSGSILLEIRSVIWSVVKPGLHSWNGIGFVEGHHSSISVLGFGSLSPPP